MTEGGFFLQTQNINKILLDILDKDLDKIARKTNFKTRNSKLNPHNFLWISCLTSLNLCSNTLEELCDFLFFHKNIKISPQALDQRIKNNSQNFFKYIFQSLCKIQFRNNSKAFKSWGFSKIFLMDSTEMKLDDSLKKLYPGANKLSPSILKINLLLELLNYSVEHIQMTAGKTNEHNFSNHVYHKLNPNSLVLKDLGYFSFEDFMKIDEKGAFFISRLRAGTRLFTLNPNPEFKSNGTILEKSRYLVTNAGELVQELAIGECKEFEFLLGSHKEKMPYRIILTRMHEDFKNNKLKAIKEDEKRNKRESKATRNELEVSGFVTNLWGGSAEEIMEIYRLRWQIELLFKILKTDFDLKKIRKLKVERIEAHIYSTLIKFMLTLEITKEISGGYIPEISIRRILKSSKILLNNLIETLKNKRLFLELLKKLSEIIKDKKKSSA